LENVAAKSYFNRGNRIVGFEKNNGKMWVAFLCMNLTIGLFVAQPIGAYSA